MYFHIRWGGSLFDGACKLFFGLIRRLLINHNSEDRFIKALWVSKIKLIEKQMAIDDDHAPLLFAGRIQE